MDFSFCIYIYIYIYYNDSDKILCFLYKNTNFYRNLNLKNGFVLIHYLIFSGEIIELCTRGFGGRSCPFVN